MCSLFESYLVAAERVFGPCRMRVRLNACSALCSACPACSAAAFPWCSAVFGNRQMLVQCSAERVFVCSASF